jgi:hypothetical protein
MSMRIRAQVTTAQLGGNGQLVIKFAGIVQESPAG